MEIKTKELKTLDIFDLGKDTFNFHYNNLKTTKKSLKNYMTIINLFTKTIKDHLESINKVFTEIKKYTGIDKPYNFLTKFEILIKLYYDNNNKFLESFTNSFDALKKSINKTLNNISDYLSFSQKLAINIKNTSENYFPKYDKLMEALDETEIAIIEEYTKKKYRIVLNKQKNKGKNKDKCAQESLVLERDYLNSEEEIKEKANNYIDEYNNNIKSIKPKMNILNEDTKNEIKNIIEKMKNYYGNLINEFDEETNKINNIDNNEIFKKEAREFLNYRIKKDNNCEILNTINLDKYNIKIIKEEEKNLIENENYKAVPKHKKLNKNLTYTYEDIYNIVKIFYDYNFEMVNKDQYSLDKEKDKILVSQLLGKILGYNFETRESETKLITEDEKKTFLSLIFSNDEYLMKFLICLNNFRAAGRYEMSYMTFNNIKMIFDKIADKLLIKKDKKISSYLIILSQTFYIIKNDSKYFLQKEVKNNKYFRTVEFWQDHLDDLIIKELEKFEEETKRNCIVYSEERKIKKINDILFSKIASLVTSLVGFELEKDKIDNILNPLMDKYKLPDEVKASIFSLIETNK